MKPDTRANRVDQQEQKRDLLDAIQGMPGHHKGAMIARIMKDVVAGKITAAEANEMRKVIKI
ncbi:hypothetical protein [Nitrospira sp. BLG_1]|uniref:hypothetical protein n=1 Tax=Nitrospira sp. BLG_1 TaxID=3395883 RepID=UPI0039BCF039